MDVLGLSRRQFLTLFTALGCEALPGGATATKGGSAPPAIAMEATREDKAYGAGHFGDWVEDQFGLPAYHYTCAQDKDPNAITPVYTIWRSPTDHSHQVANDRITGVASNYGYVQA